MATLQIAGLEQVYDELAQALDRVGEPHSERFLVKVALLLAQEVGDAARVVELLGAAEQDL